VFATTRAWLANDDCCCCREFISPVVLGYHNPKNHSQIAC